MSNKQKKVINRDISDYVINPVTGRLIKIDSRKYHQLLKDKMLNLPIDTRKDNVIFNGEVKKEDKEKFKVNKNMNLVTRNGKLVENRRKTTREEYLSHFTKKSAEVIKKNMDQFTDDMDDDAMYLTVKKLLAQEMIGEAKPTTKQQFKVRSAPDDINFDLVSDKTDSENESDESE